MGVSPIENGYPVAVVPGSFLWVGEDFVGGLDFGEEFGGVLDVVVVTVRV